MSNHFYDQTFGLHTASDHPFLKTEEGDISHATFAAMTARLSNALVAAGMSVGDRVAVQAEKSATLLGVCAATIRAGGVYLPLNTGYTPTEIDYFVSDARPAIIIVDPAAAADIAPLADRIGATLFTLDAASEGSLAVAAKDASAAFDTVPRGKMIWQRSSIPRAPLAVQRAHVFRIIIWYQTQQCWLTHGVSRAMMCCCICCRSITHMAFLLPVT